MKYEYNKYQSLVDTYAAWRIVEGPTLEHYRWVADLVSRETNTSDPNELTIDLVLRWRLNVLSRASDSTWNNYHRHLRALFNLGVDKGICNINPFLEVTQVKVKSTNKKTIELPLLTDVIEKLVQEYHYPPGWFWVLALKTLYYQAFRLKQFVSLEWRDLDLDNRQITLRDLANKNSKKTKRPIHDEVINGLYHLRTETYKVTGVPPKPTDQVFNITLFNKRYRGDRLIEKQVSGFFKRLTNRLHKDNPELCRVSAHRLRHTMADRAAESGNIKTLQDILGHGDLNTTSVYIHPDIRSMSQMMHDLPII